MKKLSEKVAESLRRGFLVIAVGWALVWLGIAAAASFSVTPEAHAAGYDPLPLVIFFIGIAAVALLYFPLRWILAAFKEEKPRHDTAKLQRTTLVLDKITTPEKINKPQRATPVPNETTTSDKITLALIVLFVIGLAMFFKIFR